MKMLHAIPALPVRDMERSVEFYRDKLGFTSVHKENGFAILSRDAVEIHLWAATDEDWRRRDNSRPVVSGAESFIAGTASCRVEVEGVDELHEKLRPLGILHPNAPLRDEWYGDREFGVLDPDHNLVTFFERK
jgi:catechol 2,3-dioxygenase-like lactoylglutathione lyase family enzyme